jgi:transposase
MVVAPSMIPRKSGDRQKNDKRDAASLAVLHRGGLLTAVWVPDAAHEAMRDLIRIRLAAVRAVRTARQQLSAFLLRHERIFPNGRQPWTKAHRGWLADQSFAQPAQQIVLEESIEAVRLGEQRRDRLEGYLRAQIPTWSLFPLVQNLSALRGLDTIASAGLTAAMGDPSRFASAPDFMAYVGLVPSEHSTGRKRRVGAIIKAGDVHARTLLIAAAHSYRFPPLIARQKLTAVDAVPQSFTRQTAPQLRRSCRRTAWPLACAATICCPRPATTNFPSAKVYPKLAITPRSSGRLICITSADCSPPLAPGSHQPHNPSHAHL